MFDPTAPVPVSQQGLDDTPGTVSTGGSGYVSKPLGYKDAISQKDPGRQLIGVNAIHNAYNPQEWEALKARYDAGERFAPGSQEDMKLTLWNPFVQQQWEGRQGMSGSKPAPPTPEPPTPEPPAAPPPNPEVGPLAAPGPPPGEAFNAAVTMPPAQWSRDSNPMTGTDNGMNTQQKHSIDININKPEDNPMQAQTMAMPPQAPTGPYAQPMPTPAAQMPYPQPPAPQQQGPYDPYQGQAPYPVAPATPAGPFIPLAGGGRGERFVDAEPTAGWGAKTQGEDNYYGPQQIAGSRPDQADYGSVQGYADAAHQNARRYLDPQQAQQNRRFDQELINKGIDPMSAQGREAAQLLGMQQADANNAAAFSSLGFGQGIQNQMTQQDLARSGLAADMQQALWNTQLGYSGQDLQRHLGNQQAATARAQMENQFNLGMRGMDLQNQNMQNQYNLGKSGQDLQRYGMDQNYQLGQGKLDLGRQGQSFDEMLGLEGLQYRDAQTAQQQQNWEDQFLYNMMMGNQGFAPGGVSGGGQFTGQSGPGGFGNFLNFGAGLIPGT
jgi:hypothetical protein